MDTSINIDEKIEVGQDYSLVYNVTNPDDGTTSDIAGQTNSITSKTPNTGQINNFQLLAAKSMPENKIMSVSYNQKGHLLTVVVRPQEIVGFAITIKALSGLVTNYLARSGIDVILAGTSNQIADSSLGDDINFAIVKPITKAVNNVVASAPDSVESFIVNGIGGTVGNTIAAVIKPLVLPLIVLMVIAVVGLIGYSIFMKKAVT